MNKDAEVEAYSRAIGKQAGKTLVFFFLKVPAAIFAFVLFLFFPIFVGVIALAIAGVLYYRKQKAAKLA